MGIRDNQNAHDEWNARGLSGLVGLLSALVCLLLPATGFANSWFAGNGQCFESTADVASGVLDFDDDADNAGFDGDEGCDGLSPDDPSYNVCFENADVPVSTLPELMAEADAARLSARILAKAAMAVGTPEADALARSDGDVSADDTESAPAKFAPLEIPRPRPTPTSCSVYPVECRSLPPAPPQLVLDATSPAAHSASWRGAWPEMNLDELLPRASAPLRVGPSEGYERELERPPEFA